MGVVNICYTVGVIDVGVVGAEAGAAAEAAEDEDEKKEIRDSIMALGEKFKGDACKDEKPEELKGEEETEETAEVETEETEKPEKPLGYAVFSAFSFPAIAAN